LDAREWTRPSKSDILGEKYPLLPFVEPQHKTKGMREMNSVENGCWLFPRVMCWLLKLMMYFVDNLFFWEFLLLGLLLGFMWLLNPKFFHIFEVSVVVVDRVLSHILRCLGDTIFFCWGRFVWVTVHDPPPLT